MQFCYELAYVSVVVPQSTRQTMSLSRGYPAIGHDNWIVIRRTNAVLNRIRISQVIVRLCKHVFVATEQPSNCRNSSAVPGKSDRSIRDVWLVSFFPGDLALSDGWLLTTISLLFAATSKSRFPTTCTGRRVPSLVLGFNHLSHCVGNSHKESSSIDNSS